MPNGGYEHFHVATDAILNMNLPKKKHLIQFGTVLSVVLDAIHNIALYIPRDIQYPYYDYTPAPPRC